MIIRKRRILELVRGSARNRIRFGPSAAGNEVESRRYWKETLVDYECVLAITMNWACEGSGLFFKKQCQFMLVWAHIMGVSTLY